MPNNKAFNTPNNKYRDNNSNNFEDNTKKMDNQNNNSLLYKLLIGYDNTKKPLEKEVGDYLRMHTYSPEHYSNALRHQYASAVFANKYSPIEARLLGIANEAIPLSGFGDMVIDLDNNKIGREYAMQHPNYTKEQYLEGLFNNLVPEKYRKINKGG